MFSCFIKYGFFPVYPITTEISASFCKHCIDFEAEFFETKISLQWRCPGCGERTLNGVFGNVLKTNIVCVTCCSPKVLPAIHFFRTGEKFTEKSFFIQCVCETSDHLRVFMIDKFDDIGTMVGHDAVMIYVVFFLDG